MLNFVKQMNIKILYKINVLNAVHQLQIILIVLHALMVHIALVALEENVIYIFIYFLFINSKI